MFWCCTSQEAGNEVKMVETPAVDAGALVRVDLNDERGPHVHSNSQPGTRKVIIHSARDLRDADAGFGMGGSDPYVVCEIVQKPSSKVQTKVVNDQHSPTWEFQGELHDFVAGNSLRFSVLDKDAVGSDPLGAIVFPYESFGEEGFSGEVLLEGNDGRKSYLKVSIAGAHGGFPTQPEPVTEVHLNIGSAPLGLDLDTLDEKFARVLRILEDSKIAEYNKTAPPGREVKEGDFICCVNNGFGLMIINKIKEGGQLNLTIRRSEEFTVELEPKGGSLGLDLAYEAERAVMKDILVKRVLPGGAAAQSGVLFQGDRLTRAPGAPKGTLSLQLMEALHKVKNEAKIELGVLRVKGTPSSGPVDVSTLLRMAKDDDGMLPQPKNPKARTALIQVFVWNHPFGGSDKSFNGHRYDSIPFANGLINAGMSCQLLHYLHWQHDQFFEVCRNFQALIVRVNPGQIKADGGDQTKFDNAMRQMRRLGIQVWPSPDVMEQMGAKDALVKIAKLSIGLEDTLAYYTEEEFAAGFKKTMKFQPRVIKQNRGSAGEGIWIVKLKNGGYCKHYGEESCADSDVLILMEANDNHAEEHTVAEFIEFCVRGRTDKSGAWRSQGAGRYLEGGKAAGGQLVDQRFCPRIVEGELRYNMAGDTLVGIIHKKPADGGISAVAGTGSIYTFYGPEEPAFQSLTSSFLRRDLPKIMPSLGLEKEPIPLWWTTDFINASPVGTPKDQEKWIVGEFNCSCVGISKCLAAYANKDAPRACYSDIPPADRAEAQRLGDLIGEKARKILLG